MTYASGSAYAGYWSNGKPSTEEEAANALENGEVGLPEEPGQGN